MANVAIYYRERKKDSTETAIEYVNKLIEQLEVHHKIKGVFIDAYGGKNELNELLNSQLSHIDYIFIEESFDDEFDNKLLEELSKTEKFKIKYFSEI